ncbi:cation diffusion facilitator CzcD-associated flavoprotein CzcO [Streptomyces aurantiacus]|uniref:flavin-containing monooxygenase n=1 Tax=Streptomyces aurantiacus TaxID=47760 RepID=UPI0027911EB5|nr:NAD(P)/FAD-dependent oxidoreductase [Streptomyces aurantiacus]MDQ0778824.1 cation diffusion facilitator CzcD-associated flavoprotein CzcO [Streptomyces aurantiacus]
MRIGIIGAGVAGLTTAKVLKQAGHDVVVFDKAPDVGGVWGVTRRYPGVSTQSPKTQYSLSDFPMPKDYPEWPSGPQVQAYFASYADHFGLPPHLRLNTAVTRARPVEGGWSLEVRDTDGTRDTVGVDRLVVANGVFCEPAVPDYPGLDEFTEAGGRLVAATDFHDAEEARDRHVLVVGYGKSACDVAVAISGTAASTDVIARQLLWKVPRRIGGLLNFKMLLLTRMGEALFRYLRPSGFERFLHGPGNGLRRRMLNSVGAVSVRQYRLKKLGLVPEGRMEDIVKGAIGLGTEGFFEGVEAGTITVHRDRTVTRLLTVSGRPHARLDDGTLLAADTVVCATGFRQEVPFLDEEIQQQLLDERGNFMLYRQIMPLDAPGLYFNGYNSSFFSPLNAEMAAVWIAADLAGLVPLPDPRTRRQRVVDQIAFMDGATDGHHCRNTKIIPFSLHNADEVLDDLGLNIGRRVRAGHWLNPVDPAAYRRVTPALIERLGQPSNDPDPQLPAAEPLLPSN